MKAVLSWISELLFSGELVTDNTVKIASGTYGNPSKPFISLSTSVMHGCCTVERWLGMGKKFLVSWLRRQAPFRRWEILTSFVFASLPVIQWCKTLDQFWPPRLGIPSLLSKNVGPINICEWRFQPVWVYAKCIKTMLPWTDLELGQNWTSGRQVLRWMWEWMGKQK